MSKRELSLLSSRIRRFKSRKAQEFPELGIKVGTDYDNFHSLQYPKHYSQLQQLIKRY